MNKQIKALLIVVPICFVLAGIAVLVCLLDWSFDIDYAYAAKSKRIKTNENSDELFKF